MTSQAFDVTAKSLRGPLVTTQSGLTTWARLFVSGGRFYIAESDSRGNRVRSVTEYEMPEGDPNHGTRTWGPWSWKQCTCSNGWKRHTVESLLALVTPVGSIVTGGEGIDVPDGDLEAQLAWLASTDEMAERKARATAIYESQSQAGADLDGLDALLDAAVYGENPTPVDASDLLEPSEG